MMVAEAPPALRAVTLPQRARAFLRAALGDDPIADRSARRALWATGALFAVLFFALSYLRYDTFHNHTFDLAFYARMSWGVAHFDGWQPIVSASVWGLHLVWLLHLVGWVGELLGHAPTLLAVQALALGATAIPLGRIAARRFGERAVWAAPLVALVFFLHPNTAHVAAGDFHPGTVAVLPIAWMMDALHRKSAEGLVLASLGVFLCREDLGLVTALGALLLAWRSEGRPRHVALLVALISIAYVAYFALVLLPRFGPGVGSLALHFGSRGASTTEVVLHLLGHPGELVAHLSTPERLAYLPTVLAPLALLPLLAPELLVASPLLAVALLSEFPTATHLDSHYLTPALPVLVSAALAGLERAARAVAVALELRLMAPMVAATLAAQLAGGGTPLGAGFDRRAYSADDNTSPARNIVAVVGPDRSIQAPDALLAHFAARRDLRRPPPPEAGTDFVVLDVSHRRRLIHDEDLLRTDEEPNARAWLSRDDHALVALGGDYALLERDRDPREGIGFVRHVTEGADPGAGRALCDCLRIAGARWDDEAIELSLVASGSCPPDLALRIGVGYRPRRVDLLAEGAVSPAHLRAGDRIRSRHLLSEREREAIRRDGLRVGALRESGAPPEHGDPPALDVVVD